MERKVSAGGGHRGVRLTHPLGNRISPAADLLSGGVERRQRHVAESATAGQVPPEGPRSPRSEGEGSLVLLSQSIRRHARDERLAGAPGDARELRSEGCAERPL